MVSRATRTLEHQVVIAGGGPAGSTAAAALASAGISVVVLEKRRSTGDKPCAGGILRRTMRIMPKALASCAKWQDEIRKFYLSCGSSEGFERSTRGPLAYTVLRTEFDKLLAEHAERSGAQVLRGQCVERVEVDAGLVVAETRDLRVRARVLIGADGAGSLVARQFDMVRRLDLEPAFVMRVAPPAMGPWRGRVAIDWDAPAGGYSWVFPKADHLSAGAVGQASTCEELRKRTRGILAACVGTAPKEMSESFGCVPLGTSDLDRARERVLLVGDAASLVDPFTREGLSWAFWSAQLAAKAATAFLGGRTRSLLSYEALLEEELLPELRAAAEVAEWFYSDPLSAHRMLRDSPLVWHAFCRVLTGRISYRALLRKLPSLASRG